MLATSIDLSRLTVREREVYLLVREGLTNAEIAAKLGIGLRTAEGHRLRVHRLLDLHRVVPLRLGRKTNSVRLSLTDEPDLSVLSPRQREVYDLVVVEGLTSTVAAARLGIGVRTVAAHRTAIAARLRSPRQHRALLVPANSVPTPKGKNLALTTDLRGVPGDVLRAARAALGWTIQKAAKESGVSSVTLSKIESGPPRTTIGPADEPILAAYLRAGVAIYREGSAFWISVRRAE